MSPPLTPVKVSPPLTPTVVSPFRALMAARFQVLWNLAHRGRGAAGTLLALLIIGIAIACLVPPAFMFWTFGRVLGEDLAAPGSPSLEWLRGLHALVLLGLGSLAGLRHQAGFDRSFLRSFPLRPEQVLLAELPFNLIDTLPVLGFTMLAALGAGLASVLPGASLHAIALAALGMIGLLLVQQAVGAARRLLAERAIAPAILRLAPTAVAAIAMVAAGPEALRAAALGETGRALGLLAAQAIALLALFAGAVALQLVEMRQDPPDIVGRGRGEKLWTFKTPAEGVARLMVAQVVTARAGVLALVLPLFCSGIFVLAADIIRRSAIGREPTGFLGTALELVHAATDLPLYALVPPAVMLLNGELWMNQFAWDGAGVKTLLLSPLRAADIVRGKLGGLILLQLPQAFLACLPLVRLRGPREFELLTGLVAGLMVAVSLSMLGVFLSVRFPRLLAVRGGRAESAPAALTLLVSAILVAHAALIAAITMILGPIGPWAPAAAFGAGAALLLLAHPRLAPLLGSQVDAHRERLSETLG